MTTAERDKLYMTPINDSDFTKNAKELIRTVAMQKRMRITTEAEDMDKNASKLVKALKIYVSSSPTEKVQGRLCTKVTGDGATFEGIQALEPGTSVCYDVIPVDAQTLFPAKPEPQVVKAKIKVMGDGSVLNSGIAYFLIPPQIETNEIN